jgi:phosphate starvation-inducible protein PhoH and related proteins
MPLSDKEVVNLIDKTVLGDNRYLVKKAKKAMSKKSKRNSHELESPPPHKTPLSVSLKKIKPLTEQQAITFEYFANGMNLSLQGVAGTGKTFIAMYLGFMALQQSKFKKIIIFRSTVPSRDVGFLPGSVEEKIRQYEIPYRDICAELHGRADAYDIMIKKGVLEFVSTSYLRGLTFKHSLMIIDEVQNCSFQECDTIITRVGEGSKVIIAGDYHQSDLLRDSERNGLKKFLDILRLMPENEFAHVDFGIADIVRDGLVKSYILAREKHHSKNG